MEKKILSSVETGDDFYVRMLYHPDDHKSIKYIYRHLYDTTKDTFGEECTKKMFCLPQSPVRGDLHALEENYAKVLQNALQSNPQQDEEDQATSKTPQRRQQNTKVFFGSSNVDRSYASITKKSQIETVTKPSESKKEVNMKEMKEELLKEVTAYVNTKINNVERKLDKKLNTIRMENDSKIDSLTELVKSNSSQMDANMKEQFKQNNADLVAQLTFLFGNQNKSNPPNDKVEHGSQSGGSN